MTRLLLLSCIFLTLSPAFGQVSVRGHFQNSESYSQVYLYELFGQVSREIDSFPLNNGRFTMDLVKERGFYQIALGEELAWVIILGNEDFSFSYDLNNPESGFSYKNSEDNTLYKDYLLFNQEIGSEFKILIDEETRITAMPAEEQDQERLQAIDAEKQAFGKSRLDYLQDIIEQHPATFMAKVAGASIYGDVKETFFDLSDFSDPEMVHGDMLTNKVYYYFRRFVTQDIRQWEAEMDAMIARTAQGSRSREYYYLTFVQLLAQAAPTRVWEMAAKYQQEYPASPYFSIIKEALPARPPIVGDIAPDFTLNDPDGNPIKLSDLRGKVVLLDFWASWCGPCRVENPNVVRVYQKYKEEGFTVLGVSLDRNREKWLQAIEKDELTWNHVSDLQGWKSAGAAAYQVRAIPAAYLLDQEGRIIAKNLRGKQLDQKLEEIFNSN